MIILLLSNQKYLRLQAEIFSGNFSSQIGFLTKRKRFFDYSKKKSEIISAIVIEKGISNNLNLFKISAAKVYPKIYTALIKAADIEIIEITSFSYTAIDTCMIGGILNFFNAICLPNTCPMTGINTNPARLPVMHPLKASIILILHL